MKFNLIKREKIIIENNLHKYYKYIFSRRKVVLVLSNQNEFLDLYNVTKYFRRKFINNFDPNYIEDKTVLDSDINFIKTHYIPLVKGFNISYHGNFSLNIIQLFKHYPSNKEIGIYRLTNPGYIKNKNNINVLDLNSSQEYLLKNFKQNEVISYVDYINMNTKLKYNKIESIYKFKEVIDLNSEYDKKDVIINYMYQSYRINYDLLDELLSIPKRLDIIVNSLNNLKKDGDFFHIFIHVITETSLQIFSELSKLFESYEYIESTFEFSSNGMIIFRKYIGSHDFNTILDNYKKMDPSLGSKYVDNTDDIILFNLDVEIDNKFLSFYEDIIDKKILKYEQLLTKIKYIEKRKDNANFIKKIINDQIDYAIKFCKKYKLNINRFYKDFNFKLKKEDFLKKVFPKANINYKKLQLDFESTYSISYPKDAEEISSLIKKKYPNLKTIADMTANVGGNTINFCKNFEFVYSVELETNIFKMLENNIKVYNINNCKVINMNSNDFYENVDLYFYDPPWTGIFYKTNVNMSLYLSSKNLKDVLKENFCLKVPINYNYSELLDKFKNLEIIKLKHFVIIFNNSTKKNEIENA